MGEIQKNINKYRPNWGVFVFETLFWFIANLSLLPF
jgi:hypothetical protein